MGVVALLTNSRIERKNSLKVVKVTYKVGNKIVPSTRPI